ncbi:MAG TPA: hypothetical protein VJ873_08805 [bacterium]|nr:hypothetical protein [bacterium]
MNRYRSTVRLAILLLASTFLLQACSKVSGPTNPVASAYSANPTPTPVISGGVSEINWYIADLSRYNSLGSSDTYAEVYLSVGGQAESTATVVLSGYGSPVTLPYVETLTLGSSTYARYYLDGTAISYQPGVSYTLSTQTSVGTAWASVVAPGGIRYGNTGDTVSWSSEGTKDRVYVENSSYSGTYDSLNSHADVDSMFTIPASAYPTSGSYFVRTTCDTVVTSVNNAMTGSSLEASDMLWATVSR